MTLAVALLDASLGDTPAQRNFARVLDAEVSVFEVSDGDDPPDQGSFDAAVISGSQTAVYDERGWIDGVRAWARRAVAADLPVLGVCWGHQLLADALGGRVGPMGGYELGYSEVRRVADSPLFAGVPETFVAFTTHGDAVAALPPGARTLAENDCALQAFRFGSAFGVQFHPEYDLETVRHVAGTKRDRLGDARVDEVLATATPARHAETRDAARVFENFLAFAAER